MDGASLADYYNSLFVIAVSVIGVGIASVIALTQILRPLLTFKSTQKLLRSWEFIATAVLLLTVTLATAGASYFLSVKKHNLLTFVDVNTEDIIVNDWFAALCLLALISAFILIAYLIAKEARYLIPENALKFIKETISKAAVKEYFDTMHASYPMPPIRFSIFGEEETEEDKKTDLELEQEYEKRRKKYEADKKKFERLENPLIPLEAYLMQAVKRNDLQATIRSLKTFEEFFLEQLEIKNSSGLSSHLTQYYAGVLGNAIELADAAGLQSFVQEMILSSNKLADRLLEERQSDAINNLVTLWQEVADAHMHKHPSTFNLIMSSYRNVGEAILRDKKAEADQNETLNNIARALGWLGERMLVKSAPEKKLIMNLDYETEFNALMNAVLGIGWAYQRDRADVYPLIFFDALYVIADKLAPYSGGAQGEYDNSDTLFSLMYEMKSFAEAAILAKNARGAALALRGVKDQLKIAKENNLEEQVKHCLEAVLDIGAIVSSAHLDEKVDFLMSSDGTIRGEAIKILSENHYGYDLSHAASEIIIKFDRYRDYEETKRYLLNVGKQLGTDFGLNLTLKEKDEEKE